MTQIKTVPVNEIEIGKAYNVVAATNNFGQPMTSIRREDWRAVLITAENIARYTSTAGCTYYVQPIKDRHTPRLLAAGWTRFSRSQGECGAGITTRGPLFGLACAKPAFWSKDVGFAMCAQHGVQELES